MLGTRLRSLARDERGQFAFPMLIGILVIFVIGALALDVGLWYFAHRDAQNDSDAAALAAAGLLPLDDTVANRQLVVDEANKFLAANGAEAATVGDCPTSDDHPHISVSAAPGATQLNTVKVCVRRKIPGLLAALSGVNIVHISAQSTAVAGGVDATYAMPWVVIAPDPNCNSTAAGPCDPHDGTATCSFTECPYGLRWNKVYGFKGEGGQNTGTIQACDKLPYGKCLQGAAIGASGFYVNPGGDVTVDKKNGDLGSTTRKALSDRLPSGAWGPGNPCDIPAKPSAVSATWGQDSTDALKAKQVFSQPGSVCAYRLVPIPIAYPTDPKSGSGSYTLLGVATFGVVGWTDNTDAAYGKSTQVCTPSNKQPTGTYECSRVWGFLLSDLTPPQALLERIGSSNNPFAPILIALTN